MNERYYLKEEERRSKKEEESPTTTTARVREEVLREAARRIGMTDAEVRGWVGYMEEVGWAFANGKPVDECNFRRSLRMWHVVEQSKAYAAPPGGRASSRAEEVRRLAEAGEARRVAQEEASRRALAREASAWVLCAERCAHCAGVLCARGMAIPPQLRARPVPPEECPRFTRKEAAHV